MMLTLTNYYVRKREMCIAGFSEHMLQFDSIFGSHIVSFSMLILNLLWWISLTYT